jgi:hypothetical protein
MKILDLGTRFMPKLLLDVKHAALDGLERITTQYISLDVL